MTRRVQFQRSSVTGTRPATLQAGTPAFNWADQKMHVGGAGDTPAFSLQKIDDWSSALIYRQKDFAIYGGDLYRALKDISAGLAFNPSEWSRLTNVTAETSGQNATTGLLTGGATSLSGSRTIQVAEGTGLIVDATSPDDVIVTIVEWGNFSFTFNPTGSEAAVFQLGIDATGSFSVYPQPTGSNARLKIPLAVGGYDTATGNLAYLWDARMFATRSLDTAWQDQQGQPLKVTKGFLLEANDAALTIAVGAGTYEGRDVNFGETSNPNANSYDGAADPAPFAVSTRTTNTGADAETIIPNTYWDNGGTMTALTAGQCVVHILYIGTNKKLNLSIGQKAYASITEAQSQYPIDRVRAGAGAHVLTVPQNRTGEIGVVFVTPEATSFSNPGLARVVMNTSGWQYQSAEENDLSNYLRLDGSTPMGADFPLGGNAPSGGFLDGEKAVLQPLRLDATGEAPSSGIDRELSINQGDAKVFLGDEVVADRTEYYIEARSYAVNDTCYYNNVLNVCIAPTTGVFDPTDWQPIGSTSDISTALVKLPDSSGRNTIDLNAAGDVTALTILPNDSQTADLAAFGDAIIDRYGMGRGTLGGIVVRVAQASHGFAAKGQPVAFNNPNWVPADASDTTTAGKALGVIYRVVNANNVDIQFGGEVTDLEVGAFVGGSISAGVAYYVSETAAGKLTTTAPAAPNRIDPVLVTTSTTAAIMQLTSAAGATIEGGVGNTSITVNQAAHGYTTADIGRPVYQSAEDDWSLARADSLATVGVGAISSVPDVNRFVVTTSGLVNNLSADAFEGGVAPTAGRAYYVSQTTAGTLTELTPLSVENRNLLFWGLSDTSGFVSGYEPEAPKVGVNGAQFMQGPLSIAGDLNADGDLAVGGGKLSLFDDVSNAVLFQTTGSEGRGSITSYDDGSMEILTFPGGIAEALYTFNADGELADDSSVVRQGTGDGRYLRISEASNSYLPLTGGRMSGGITIASDEPSIAFVETNTTDGDWAQGITDKVFYFLPIDDNGALVGISFLSINRTATGVNDARLVVEGNSPTVPVLDSILTARRGDARYLQLTGGTVTGFVTFNSPTTSFSGDGAVTLAFESGSGSVRNAIVSDPGTNLMHVALSSGGSPTIQYTFEPSGNLVRSTSVLTRDNSDGRYVQVAGGFMTGDLDMTGSNVLNVGRLGWSNGDYLQQVSGDGTFFVAGGAVVGYLPASTGVDTSPEPTQILRTQEADARYLNQIQAGVAQPDSNGQISVTFAKAFSQIPIVTMTPTLQHTNGDRRATCYYRGNNGEGPTTTGFTATSAWASPTADGTCNLPVYWMAVGPTQ